MTKATDQGRALVALQDLDEQIRDAESAATRAKYEEMGFQLPGLDQLHEAQEKLEDAIDTKLLTRYRLLADRAGRAVVPVVEGTCTGCFTNVPTSFTSSVYEGQIMNCESCGRILFWP